MIPAADAPPAGDAPDFDRAAAALARGDFAALRGALLGRYPELSTDPEANRMLGLALGRGGPAPRPRGRDALFASSIVAMRQRLQSGPAGLTARRRRLIGLEYEFLGERREAGEWSLAQTLNWLLRRGVRPTKRAAVVAAMRDDGIHALEWIAHHRALGFAGIFIYTNDNADGSEHLLRALADHGVITLIESETLGAVRPEVKAFEHAVHFLHELREHEWVLFLDSDEFFVPAPRAAMSLDRVLDEVESLEDGPAAVVYQWLWYNSGMAFARRPGLLAERFQHATPHWLTKPMVRLRDVLSMRLQHIPELLPGRTMVNSAYRTVEPEEVWRQQEPEYGGGRINHYWSKSFEEFSLKKARGDALTLASNEYHREFGLFFEWNGPDTPETHHPPDQAFLAEVKRELRELRALPGIAALESQAREGFARLVARYDAAGGLAAIYAAANPRAEMPREAAAS